MNESERSVNITISFKQIINLFFGLNNITINSDRDPIYTNIIAAPNWKLFYVEFSGVLLGDDAEVYESLKLVRLWEST